MNKSFILYDFLKGAGTVTLCCIAMTFSSFNYRIVDGNSMNVTLPEGTIIVTTNRTNNIKKGDVVILEDYVKRVVGEDGDRIVIEDGIVKVNDKLIEIKENTILSTNSDVYVDLTVKDGFFLLGESEDSYDSKNYGVVSGVDEKVIGYISL